MSQFSFAYSEIAVPNLRNSKKLEFTLNYRLSVSLLLLFLYLVISLNVVNELFRPLTAGRRR